MDDEDLNNDDSVDCLLEELDKLLEKKIDQPYGACMEFDKFHRDEYGRL